MAKPLVTVITPAYNVGKYIGEAIASVSAQTFEDFEYLLIDDGSVDDTAAVIADHARRDPRIRLIQAAHLGHSAARNRGIREAQAEYIAFLDGDDRWHRRFLHRQVSLLASLPPTVGVVFCRSRVILENGTLAFYQWQRAGAYDFDEFLIKNNPARNGSSLLIRKSCFDEVGGFDEDLPSAADLEMWLRIAAKSSSPTLWGSKHYLVDWRLRPGSVTKDRLARDMAMLRLLDYHASHLQHSHASRAYVLPALSALKYGSDDDIAEQLAARARELGTANLARSPQGLRLLFWHTLSRSGRQAVRSLQSSSREIIKKTNTLLRGK